MPDHGEKPRGHTAQIGHVLPDACLHQQGQFPGPILHQCNAPAGDTHQIGQWIHFLDEVGAEVPYPHPRLELQVVGKTAPQNERFARKYAALGVQIQIM